MASARILKSARTIPLAALAVALPIAGAAVAAGAPQVIGIAAAVLNDVSIASGGAAQMHPAVLRERVALADRVQTGQRSRLQLMLLDRTTFTVGANARLTIDRFVYDPARGGNFDASVAKGAFRFLSGRRAPGGSSSIRTPIAVIGIRGTALDGVVGEDAIAIARAERGIGRSVSADPQTASLILLRGPGAATEAGLTVGAVSIEAGGQMVTLQSPMQAAFVPRAGAAPIGPFVLSPSGLQRLESLIEAPLAAPTRTARGRSGTGKTIETLLKVGIGVMGAVGGSRDQQREPQQTAQPDTSQPPMRTATAPVAPAEAPSIPRDPLPDSQQVK